MTLILSILFLLSPLLALAQAPMPPTNAVQTHYPVRLAWDPSPDDTVAGYKLYSGPATATYTNAQDVGTNLTGLVWSPIGSTSYYVVTAYLTNGLESIPSNEVTNTVTRPAPPSGTRVVTVTTTVNLLRAPSLNGPWVETPLTASLSITNPTAAELFRASWDKQLSIAQSFIPEATP
jgi:hypothetical protein